MSQPTTKPCFVEYTPRSSGDVFTGEVQHVRGGGRAATVFSGLPSGSIYIIGGGGAVTSPSAGGPDLLLWSGAGRLNSILQHIQAQSGAAAVFYDSAIATSGGPFAASGHKIVGILPPSYTGATLASGIPAPFTGAPINVDFPFQSGLCVHNTSGTPGYSVSFTVEVSAAFPSA